MPISIGGIDESLSLESNYKKQIDIFKDDSGGIYIKPNELLKLINVPKAKYKLRIHFLRNIKATLGKFLNLMKNNLIENGNFFAGLEATQTGDLDRSIGKNTFSLTPNPGYGLYVLEQNGIPSNEYIMRVTGIEPNSSYVFSCWVAWDPSFTPHNTNFHVRQNDGKGIVGFSNASSQGSGIGFSNVINTNENGSFIDSPADSVLQTTNIGTLNWFRLYSFVQTDGNANLGSILIHVGRNENYSTAALGKRFFTDLRFERVDTLFGSHIQEYISKLKSEPLNSSNSDYFSSTVEEN